MQYSGKFKDAMVRKMTGPNAISANELAREVGVSQTALSRWLRQASERGVCAPQTNTQGALSVIKAKRPKDWTPEEKYHVVIEAEALSQEELGAFLRKKGIYDAQLTEWREQMLSALTKRSSPKSSKDSGEKQQIRRLEKELERKEKALAETAALLVLQKKAQILFGEEKAEPTPRRNGN